MVESSWDTGNAEVDRALRSLLGGDSPRPPGLLVEDLIEAAKESLERRKRNSRDGGAVLRYLHDTLGMTWERISDLTGIPVGTAYRWAEPPA